MELFDKNLDKDFVVIAEIGCNHEGKVNRAVELMWQALNAGADAVKFQMGVVSSGPKRTGGKYVLTESAMRYVADRAPEGKIFASALDSKAIKFCAEHFPVMKIASRDAKSKFMLQAAAETEKPLIISTGNMTEKEVKRSLRWVSDKIGRYNLKRKVVLLHCVSAYPTPIEEANVLAMNALAKTGVRVGWSNHVLGDSACLAAVAQGASVIEVHFTDDKTRAFRDHALSFTASELIEFIVKAHQIRKSLGTAEKKPQPSEEAA